MAIAPNSTIILYSGMPLDNDYSDTLYFNSLSAQTTFFQTYYKKHTLAKNTYQRVNSGVFEAQLLADLCYDCNYMAFQNTNFGNKWFYAFIDSVEYVNNGNALIRYTIDVMQTYLFDVTLEECFVEREHSVTDPLFGNIIPEPNIVPLGEYQFEGYEVLDPMTPDHSTEPGHTDEYLSAYYPDIVLMYVDVNGSTVDGGVFNNTYSGAKVVAFTSSSAGVAALEAMIASYIQQPQAIINLYMCPHFLSRGTDAGRDLTPANFFSPNVIEFDPTYYIPLFYERINGWAPRNNKLFSYPYCYLHLDDGGTASMSLRFEFFNALKWKFHFIGSNFAPVQFTIMPNEYKGIDKTYGMPLESLTIQSYPLCSWNYDTYRAWEAQNSVPMLIGSAVSGVGSILSGDLSGLVNTGVNAFNQFYKASIAADTIRGNINNGNALYGWDQMKFHIARAHLPMQYLAVMDEFFTMYGYATNRVKVPNRNARPYYTYTKTAGCKLYGQCPADALVQLRAIYDHGITFWKDAANIGNYNVNNNPT